MNTLLVILKITDARRDVMLAGGLDHRFPLDTSSLPLVSLYDNSFACIVIHGEINFYNHYKGPNRGGVKGALCLSPPPIPLLVQKKRFSIILLTVEFTPKMF